MHAPKPIPNAIGGSGFTDDTKFAHDLSFMSEEDWGNWLRNYDERMRRKTTAHGMRAHTGGKEHHVATSSHFKMEEARWRV